MEEGVGVIVAIVEVNEGNGVVGDEEVILFR